MDDLYYRRDEARRDSFGIALFGDANDPMARFFAGEAAGFGNLSPEGLAAVIDMGEEGRDEYCGVSRHKKISVFASCGSPRPYLELRAVCDQIAHEFEVAGWSVPRSGLDQIEAPRLDWEAQEALAEWLWGNHAPSEEMLGRLTAKRWSFVAEVRHRSPQADVEERELLRRVGRALNAEIGGHPLGIIDGAQFLLGLYQMQYI